MELYEHLPQISQMWNNKTDVNKKQTQTQQQNPLETQKIAVSIAGKQKICTGEEEMWTKIKFNTLEKKQKKRQVYWGELEKDRCQKRKKKSEEYRDKWVSDKYVTAPLQLNLTEKTSLTAFPSLRQRLISCLFNSLALSLFNVISRKLY